MDFLRGYARWLISFLVVALSLFARSESRVQENGDGGPALAASINGPSGIVIDNEGNLYVVEQESSRVRRVDVKTGTINTVAGNGKRCCFEEGKRADSTTLHYPKAVALDHDGNVYIIDTIALVRRVALGTATITTVVREAWGPRGTEPRNAPSLPSVSGIDGIAINRADPASPIYLLSGKILEVDGNSMKELTVNEITKSTGKAWPAQFSEPLGIAVDSAGDLFVADREDCRIFRVDAGSKLVSTIAGTGTCESSGDYGPATLAAVDRPFAIAVDARGNVFFSDAGPSCVRRIDAETGLIWSVKGTCEVKPEKIGGPAGLAADRRGNLYLSLWASNLVRRVDAITGSVTTVAGNGSPDRQDIYDSLIIPKRVVP